MLLELSYPGLETGEDGQSEHRDTADWNLFLRGFVLVFTIVKNASGCLKISQKIFHSSFLK